MAIGRITGPMLFRNLERQGVDLSFDGNLVYLDVINRRVGINTSTPGVEFEVVGSANITANLWVGERITVGNHYTLPTESPGVGYILTAYGGDYSNTYWAPGPPINAIRRRRYATRIEGLLGYGTVSTAIPLGVSSIVYGLTVSRPVKVEVFGTPDYNEPNPYTFIATPDHLTDDGTVILNDGSSFQSRQYSIFANLEDPPTQNVYVKLTSIDSYLAATPVDLSLWYYPAVTDSGNYVDVVNTLPTLNLYLGKMVLLTTNNKIYFYAPSGWVQMN